VSRGPAQRSGRRAIVVPGDPDPFDGMDHGR
jgi:hypothetical protein